jgi:hypothetical protein
MKTCCKCKNQKDLVYFGRLASSSDGYRYDCKDCRHSYNIANREKTKQANKEYYNANKDTLLIKNRNYRLTNSDAINKQRKEYRSQDNIKEHIKRKNKEYLPVRKQKIKELRVTDLNFKLSEVLRTKFHKYLNGKSTSLLNILGCDLDFFKRWISFRFDETMSWNNYGSEWHIDHVLPINKFFLDDQIQVNICYHWTNLQPLSIKENQSKSDKILLFYYFNNFINIFRFNQMHKQYIGYQAAYESLQWLRKTHSNPVKIPRMITHQ